MLKQRLKLFIPLGIFLILSGFFLRGLYLDPTEVPSALIDKSFPEFSLPLLEDEATMANRDDVVGEFALVNIWATWCVACKVEHPFLVQLGQEGMKIVGVNWKDDSNAARRTLEETGNPYAFSVIDQEGRLTFDLGVYGAPETYLVNPEGFIVYKHVGILDKQIWQEKFVPLMNI